MKYTHRIVLFFFIAFLLSSCRHQDREVYLDFQENPLEWMPDESTHEIIYSDSLGNTLDYTLDYINNGTRLVGIEAEEGDRSYYFGTWKSLSYFESGGEKPMLNYEYYIKFKEYAQVDMLTLHFGNFSLDMAIPDQASGENEFYYAAYSNYLFADSLLLNGQTFESVYFRESLDGKVAIYYQKGKVIGLKSNDVIYLLIQ